MSNISKELVLDVLSTCIIRHTTDTKCKDCKYYGPDCLEAHEYANSAVKYLKKSEVENGRKIAIGNRSQH